MATSCTVATMAELCASWVPRSALREVVGDLDVLGDDEGARALVHPPHVGQPPLRSRRDKRIAQARALEHAVPGPREAAHVRRIADGDHRAPALFFHQLENVLGFLVAVL